MGQTGRAGSRGPTAEIDVHKTSLTLVAILSVLVSVPAAAQPPEANRAALREIYEEMVEIDSSPTTGSCTKVVRAAESRLLAAGYTPGDVQVIIPPDRPDDGNLVATLRSAKPTKKGVLLMGHIDVVDARREDWERDPFTLVEENGFFFGRGTADMKGQAAVWLEMMIRLRKEANFRPSRDLVMALTCGEETSNRINGIDYILTNHRNLFDVAFALNEGAGGLLADDGRHLVLQVQAGEKIHQVFTLEVTNPGGHSSRPTPDNAIYRVVAAADKVSKLSFPIELTPVVREYFRITGPILGGGMGAAMSILARYPDDSAALRVLLADPSYNAFLHTTCVATQLEAGHAPNALPQRATVTLSCRVMQGTTPEQVKETLEAAINDPEVKVAIVRRREGSSAPPLTDEIMEPIKAQAAKIWPDVPIAPLMTAGATDGRFLMNAGIPTYGLSGMFAKSGETNAHGLNEKLRVQSLYEGQQFLEGVVRAYVK
jgi:acetylornithine deacetylase/succinyl-diaminopimelate desuccinylase-like protein